MYYTKTCDDDLIAKHEVEIKKRILVLSVGPPSECLSVGFSFLTKLPHNYDVQIVGRRNGTRGILSLLVTSISLAMVGMFSCDAYDIIISQGAVTGIFCSLLCNLSRKGCKRCIFSVGMSYLKRFTLHRLVGFFVSKLMNNTDIVFCYSSAEVSFWKRFRSNVFFFPLSILYQNTRVGCTDQNSDYIFSGGLTDRDYLTLVQAVKDLDVLVYLAIGKNPLTGKYDYIPAIPSKFRLFRDVSPKDFDDMLDRSKMVVLPLKNTHHNVGQTVLLKAMFAGKPIIATKCPGTIDYIQNYKTGILVPPNDPHALRQAIIHLSDKNVGATFAIRARTFAESNLSPTQLALRFLSFFG